MKKLFYALITLTIMVLALPQSVNAYSPQSSIHLLATDIGSHATLVVLPAQITATPDLPMIHATIASAAIPHEAEVLPLRLRTTPKLTRQSQYFSSNFACSLCQLNSNGWRSWNQPRESTI